MTNTTDSLSYEERLEQPGNLNYDHPIDNGYAEEDLEWDEKLDLFLWNTGRAGEFILQWCGKDRRNWTAEDEKDWWEEEGRWRQ